MQCSGAAVAASGQLPAGGPPGMLGGGGLPGHALPCPGRPPEAVQPGTVPARVGPGQGPTRAQAGQPTPG